MPFQAAAGGGGPGRVRTTTRCPRWRAGWPRWTASSTERTSAPRSRGSSGGDDAPRSRPTPCWTPSTPTADLAAAAGSDRHASTPAPEQVAAAATGLMQDAPSRWRTTRPCAAVARRSRAPSRSSTGQRRPGTRRPVTTRAPPSRRAAPVESFRPVHRRTPGRDHRPADHLQPALRPAAADLRRRQRAGRMLQRRRTAGPPRGCGRPTRSWRKTRCAARAPSAC